MGAISKIMSSQQYSVYIPRMFPNITEGKVKEVFSSMNVGTVSRVDFIEKSSSKGEKYNMVFIWFSEWYTNTAATNLKAKIEDPNTQAKFVYEDPWYWIDSQIHLRLNQYLLLTPRRLYNNLW